MILAALFLLAFLNAALLFALCRASAPRHPLDRLEDDLAQQAWLEGRAA